MLELFLKLTNKLSKKKKKIIPSTCDDSWSHPRKSAVKKSILSHFNLVFAF
jgi:hypothetical protein